MADSSTTCLAVAVSSESGSKITSYCRKQKSLGLLCSNFLSLYNRECVETIGLDDASSRLGVERRRIYDIVNVLESVGMLVRKAKNRYTWKGFGAIDKTLDDLKKEGFKENGAAAGICCFHKVSDDDEDETHTNISNLSQNDKSVYSSVPKLLGPSKSGDNKREKSLGLLTQNFVKLFLCTDMDMISLDDAAKLLLGNGAHTSMTTRTKVRRLYDIANVLSSLRFIEKTHQPDTRKPAFRWLGSSRGADQGTAVSMLENGSKRRIFGTDLTNTATKRYKMDGNTSQLLKPPMPLKIKYEASDNEVEMTRTGAKSFQFGPFAPASLPKVEDFHTGKGNQTVDWENLASVYRPQYHNQALKDLFSHYAEAWKSWYSEVDGKNQVQITS